MKNGIEVIFIKKKYIVAILIWILLLVLTGIVVWQLQTNMVSEYRSESIQNEIIKVADILENNEIQRNKVRESYYQMLQSKTNSLAFAINQSMTADGKYNLGEIKSYASILDVNSVYVVDSLGNILETNDVPKNDFLKKRFNRLRQSQNYKEQQKTSKVIYIQYEDHDWLYFSAKLLDGNFLITEISAESLKIILEGSASWENKLNAIRIGASGYVFSVSKKDFTIQSHPEENLVGRDIFECGIKEKCIYSQQLQWFEFEHQKLYGKIMETEDLYLFAVVPSGEIYSNVLYITIIIIILYIIVNSTIFLYAYYSSKQATEQACFIEIGEDGEIGIVQDTVNIGNINNFFFDRRLIRKYNVYSMIGLLVVFFGTLFLQQILSISELSVSCQYAGRGVLDEIAMHEKKWNNFRIYIIKNIWN